MKKMLYYFMVGMRIIVYFITLKLEMYLASSVLYIYGVNCQGCAYFVHESTAHNWE